MSFYRCMKTCHLHYRKRNFSARKDSVFTLSLSSLLDNAFEVSRCKSQPFMTKTKRTDSKIFENTLTEPKNILVYGDSNTWGMNPDSILNPREPDRIPYSERWTTLLEHKLNNRFLKYIQSKGQLHDEYRTHSHIKKHFTLNCDALNARTTIYSDPQSPCDGNYDCNGRKYLRTVLHSHKPLSIVILALGGNDLKAKFNTTHHDIVGAINILIRDIQHSLYIGEEYTVPYHEYYYLAEPKLNENKETVYVKKYRMPSILVIGPPIIESTPISKVWGFDDTTATKAKRVGNLLDVMINDESEKSRRKFIRDNQLYDTIPTLGYENVYYLNLANKSYDIKVSPVDGVHFPRGSTQNQLASIICDKIYDEIL